MQLIGMLDSPYVRRAAIGLKVLGTEFEHRSVSVFGGFDAFRVLNPVVKAPTLILEDGQTLMDSTLILDYATALAEARTGARKSLYPASLVLRARATRLTGLALAACDKTVQIVYELNLRPEEKQHQPWLDRVRGQLLAACAALEAEQRVGPLSADPETLGMAEITIAVTWSFTQAMLADVVLASDYPALRAFASACEATPVFVETPAV